MDDHMIQRSRYVLRSRFRNAQTCPMELFEAATAQALHWIDSHPILGNIVADLEREQAEIRGFTEEISSYVLSAREQPKASLARGDDSQPTYAAPTPRDHAAICLHVVRAIGQLAGCDAGQVHLQTQADLCFASLFRSRKRIHDVGEAIETLRDVALDGLFEYLDEQLDSRIAIHGILLKYRQRCEWFHRHRLRAVVKAGLEGRSGERALAVDLYDWLLSQSVDLVIEPVTASGEPDLVLRDPSGQHIIVDAKYIASAASPSEIRSTLTSGFHQVQRYCTDFSEPNGFMVVFIESTRRIAPDLDQIDGLPFLHIGGKQIFYIPIQISEEPSASKSGRAEEVYILREALVKRSDESMPGSG